eukprot:4090715-Amphidinium_carterae.1
MLKPPQTPPLGAAAPSRSSKPMETHEELHKDSCEVYIIVHAFHKLFNAKLQSSQPKHGRRLYSHVRLCAHLVSLDNLTTAESSS